MVTAACPAAIQSPPPADRATPHARHDDSRADTRPKRSSIAPPPPTPPAAAATHPAPARYPFRHSTKTESESACLCSFALHHSPLPSSFILSPSSFRLRHSAL